MSVLEELTNELEQLSPELQRQVLEHARRLREAPATDTDKDRETPDQVEAQAILGHS